MTYNYLEQRQVELNELLARAKAGYDSASPAEKRGIERDLAGGIGAGRVDIYAEGTRHPYFDRVNTRVKKKKDGLYIEYSTEGGATTTISVSRIERLERFRTSLGIAGLAAQSNDELAPVVVPPPARK